jgi:hypothetical protein
MEAATKLGGARVWTREQSGRRKSDEVIVLVQTNCGAAARIAAPTNVVAVSLVDVTTLQCFSTLAARTP